MKRILYIIGISIPTIAIFMLLACSGADNHAVTTTEQHTGNVDGYYNGQYTFRRGQEWGNMEIDGDIWIAQGAQESPFSGGTELFGYSGSIIGNELVVNTTMYGTNATGEVYAEFDGKDISSGGWTYKKN